MSDIIRYQEELKNLSDRIKLDISCYTKSHGGNLVLTGGGVRLSWDRGSSVVRVLTQCIIVRRSDGVEAMVEYGYVKIKQLIEILSALHNHEFMLGAK